MHPREQNYNINNLSRYLNNGFEYHVFKFIHRMSKLRLTDFAKSKR